MRKIIIGMALASTAFATPAMARNDAWYVELDFGPMIVEDSDFDIGSFNDAATLDSEYGADGGFIVGYDFGGFRLEAEASYRKADNDALGTLGAVALPIGGTSNRVIGTFGGVGGDASALSFMLNGLLDFGDDDGLQAFVGGGAGISRVSYDVSLGGGTPQFLDSSDSSFAWQVLAGLRNR